MLSRLLAVLFVTLASAASAQPASPHDQLNLRAHGRDERLGLNALYEGRKVQNRLVKAVAE